MRDNRPTRRSLRSRLLLLAGPRALATPLGRCQREPLSTRERQVRDAARAGFETYVVTDATRAVFPETSAAKEAGWREAGIGTVTSDEVARQGSAPGNDRR